MQIQDSVNAANFLSIGMGATTKEAGNNTDSDFASILSTTDQKSNDNSGGVSAEKELFPERKVQEVKKSSKSTDIRKTVDDSNNKSNNNIEDGKIDKPEPISKAEDASNEKDVDLGNNIVKVENVTSTFVDDIEFDSEDIKQIIELLGDVVQSVMNQFNLTLDDVRTTLDSLDMKFSDLLTEDGEKRFFLDIKSADVPDLLTDEALRTDMSDFMSEINDIIDDVTIDTKTIMDAVDTQVVTQDDVEQYINNISNSNELVEQPIVKENDNEVIDTVVMNNVDSNDKQDTFVEVNVQNNNSETEHKDINNKPSEKKSHTTESKTEVQNSILQGINDAINSMEDIVEVSESQTTRTSDVVEQIVEQIRVNINQDNTSLEMQLYPEHLGRIQIHVVSKDGVMTARIAAETEAAKQAVEAGLSNLKESLQNQNLKVDAIEVMVSTTAFAESDEQKGQYQQETNSRKNSNGAGFGLDEEDVEDEDDIAKMQAEGSSVSYRA